VAALCLATDLALGFHFVHGLYTTQIAMRLGDRLSHSRERGGGGSIPQPRIPRSISAITVSITFTRA
jgi:hypothetical protein